MKKLFSVLAMSATLAASAQTKPVSSMKYPATQQGNVTHEYFGTKVADPYNWLEDDRSEATEKWVAAQNTVTQNYLQGIPYRNAIRTRLESYMEYNRRMAPMRVGDFEIYAEMKGTQNQPIYYIRRKNDPTSAKVFIDPATFSKEGTASVSILSHSKDNRYVAFALAYAGSDWQEIKVLPVSDAPMLDDNLEFVKFSGAAWYGNGFFYSRYPKPKEGDALKGKNEFHQVYYHKLGTPQNEDALIYKDEKNPLRYHSLYLSEDEKYMFLSVSTGTDGFETYYKPTYIKEGGFMPITSGFDHKISILDNFNGEESFLALSDLKSPNYKVVKYTKTAGGAFAEETIIPERKDALLANVTLVGGYMVLEYLEKAASVVQVFDMKGQFVSKFNLGGFGSAAVSGGEKKDTKVLVSYTSFFQPNTVYEFDLQTGARTTWFEPKLGVDLTQFTSEQVTYTSKDGTPVTMFLVHKKGIQLNGTNPTLLYGYGGFNISLTPSFSSNTLWLLEQGGIYAVANLRGGGEYGESWHQGGMLMKKQNVFDDFIAAAEYLISKKYTDKNHLAISGGSNGGLLVGACMTQRPDLFQVAFPAVGVLDMLRFHKFTVGWGWVPEYGSSEQSEAMFKYLYGYSPLHNLKPGTAYPATMVTTGDHDDRVVPAHSFKFAARLQACQKVTAPTLIRIDVNAGHGAGKPTSKILDEQADKWAFMFWNMGFTTLSK